MLDPAHTSCLALKTALSLAGQWQNCTLQFISPDGSQASSEEILSPAPVMSLAGINMKQKPYLKVFVDERLPVRFYLSEL